MRDRIDVDLSSRRFNYISSREMFTPSTLESSILLPSCFSNLNLLFELCVRSVLITASSRFVLSYLEAHMGRDEISLSKRRDMGTGVLRVDAT